VVICWSALLHDKGIFQALVWVLLLAYIVALLLRCFSWAIMAAIFENDLDLRIRSAGHSGTIFPGHSGTCSTVPRLSHVPCQWLQQNRMKPICFRNWHIYTCICNVLRYVYVSGTLTRSRRRFWYRHPNLTLTLTPNPNLETMALRWTHGAGVLICPYSKQFECFK